MPGNISSLAHFQGKLDGYRDDDRNGKVLNEDQKAAIAKYDEVMQNLEFARELQVSFKNFVTEEDRMKKKQSKKEVGERLKAETARMATVLTYQKLLQALASNKVKDDFKKGDNGATKLTKDQLDDLEEMIKFFNTFKVTLDETDKVNASLADHLINLADGKPKKVVGGKLTYKTMNELLNLVKKSGYNFESAIITVNGSAPVQANGVSKKTMTNGKSSNADAKPQEQQQPKQQPAAPQPQVPQPTAAAPAPAPQVVPMPVTQAAMFPPPPHMSFVPQQQPGGSAPAPAPPAATGVAPTTQPSINFLQESQIDMESPHMDPAVVMVHHTAPPPTTSGGPPFNQIFIPPTTLAALQQQHFGGHFQPQQKFQQQPVPQQHHVETVSPVEKIEAQQQPPQQQQKISEDLEQPQQAQPSKPPGYASIAAGLKENKNEVKDEMPPIDDWNEEIAKEEENNEMSRDYRGGRGGGRGRGRGGNFRGRGGESFCVIFKSFRQ